MWELTKDHSAEAAAFAKDHFPIAGDSAGNDFFIEKATGIIKYVSHEYGIPNGATDVAPNFRDFCLAMRTLTY